MRSIEKQLYKITRYHGRSEFIEADSVDEVAKYVAESDKAGNTVSSVTEINLDGSHPKVAITKLKAYKDAIKEVSAGIREKNLEMARELWEEFEDVIVDDNECIENPWRTFEAGTSRYDIWHWFESFFGVSVAKDLMEQ